MAAHRLPDDINGYLERLLGLLSIKIRPLILGNISQTRDCHGIIDVRSLGSCSKSGDQDAEYASIPTCELW